MGLGIITIVHAVLALFLIIELGLVAHVVDITHGRFWQTAPSSYSFMLFTTVWSILMLIYLALARFFPRIHNTMVAFGILVITTIFWFAGSIAMAAFLGVPRCHGNNGCQTAQAAIAFGFFIWAIFTGLTIMEGLAFMRSRGHSARADTTKPGHV